MHVYRYRKNPYAEAQGFFFSGSFGDIGPRENLGGCPHSYTTVHEDVRLPCQ